MRYNLEVSSTPNCNMACTYCFEGDELKSKQKQTTENAMFIINKVFHLLNDSEFQKKYEGITINFWGGEPTLNYDWNRKIIEATRNMRTNQGHDVKFFFYSNGFNYNNLIKHLDMFDLDNRLEQDQISVQISWDGETTKNLRVGHDSKPTYIKVKENILKVLESHPNLNLGIKATINPIDLLRLEDIWKDFYRFRREAKAINKNANINFSPTLNYYDDFDTNEIFLTKLQEQFFKVVKLEQTALQAKQTEKGNPVFSWLKPANGQYTTPGDQSLKRLTNCSAGVNIGIIDLNGDLSVCHGTLYSPIKNDFVKLHNTNIKDDFDKFNSNLKFVTKELQKVHEYVDEDCTSCLATECYKCPIVNVEQARKNNPDVGIVDNFQNRDKRHCQIYKLFGPMDRAFTHFVLNYKL